ncbi:MAG TPA: YfbM family protein, partial [Pirellulales bacterium]
MGMYCEVSVAAPGDIEGFSAEPDPLDGLRRGGTATINRISLEKAWHGLHYLLTGEAWDGQGPLAFLLAGGEQIGDDDESPRWFTPEETKRIHLALTSVSDELLWSRFDAKQMEQKQIYPGIWDESEDE